jgi:hypothetical protein
VQTNLTNQVSDSRRSPRRTFQRPVGLLVQGRYAVAEAAQISEGGMLILSSSELALKDLIVVTLLLPDGGHAVARAEVLYRRKPTQPGGPAAFGLQFLNLPLMKKRIIRNYVAAKTQEEAEIDQQQEIITAGKKR